MKLAFDMLAAKSNNCKLPPWFRLNQSDHGRYEIERSALLQLCPTYFQLERMEYILALLGIHHLELVVLRCAEMNETVLELASGEIDTESHVMYAKETSILAANGKNLTFVAPYTQNRICLLYSLEMCVNT